jgi:hypothetical protein
VIEKVLNNGGDVEFVENDSLIYFNHIVMIRHSLNLSEKSWQDG